MVKKVLAESGRSPQKLVLGGFSQGAVLATHCLQALRFQGINAAALLVMSGILDAGLLRQAANLRLSARAEIAVFLSHGEDDDTIPEVLVHRAIATFRSLEGTTACRLTLETHFHEGLHEIGDGSLESAASWLVNISSRLPDASLLAASELEARRKTAASNSTATPDRVEELEAASDASSPEVLPAPDPADPPDMTDMASMSLEEVLASIDSLQESNADAELQARQAEEPTRRLPPELFASPPRQHVGSLFVPPARQDFAPHEAFDQGGDHMGQFAVGDSITLKGLKSAAHLNGLRGTLQFWDETNGRWEVEIMSTGEHVFVLPERMDRYDFDEPSRQQAVDLQASVSPRRVAELLRASIPGLFDAPQIGNLLWGPEKSVVPTTRSVSGCELEKIAGTECLVFGRHLHPSSPTMILFRGRCSDVAADLTALARAYVLSVGTRVVVPLSYPKASQILAKSRALAAAVQKTLGSGPLGVHGIYTGSIPAVQVAAEGSQDGTGMPQCRLLVLEHGIASLAMVHGAEGVIGHSVNDPLTIASSLKLVRCPIVLVRGFKENFQHMSRAFGSQLRGRAADPLQTLSDLCPLPPTILRETSSIDGGILGRFENVREKKSSKRVIQCSAATPAYLTNDFLKPSHLPLDKVDLEANYAPTSNINETRFHKGFSRRHKSDIQPDAARMEHELLREQARDERAMASVNATRQYKEQVTFNILSGQGVGRECEFRQVGKKIVNPFGCMEATFAEHARDASNRTKASKHRFFEHPAPQPQESRARTLFNEGFVNTQRESAIIGYGHNGVRRTRSQSCGASDNYAHLRALPPEPEWESHHHGNRSQIILG